MKDCQDGKRSPLLTYLNSHSGPAHLPPASWPPEKYILFRVTIWKVTSFSSFVGSGIFGRNRGVMAIGTISLNDVKSESQFWNDKIIVSINIIAAIQFWLPDKIWPSGVKMKYCQRHNGPEGWVHLAKVTFWGHNTTSNTNLDHISSSESRLSIN